jgi:hypothetical protein
MTEDRMKEQNRKTNHESTKERSHERRGVAILPLFHNSIIPFPCSVSCLPWPAAAQSPSALNSGQNGLVELTEAADFSFLYSFFRH